jgi:senataxin
MAVPFYDVFDTVLRPTLTKKPYIDPRDLEQTMEKHGVNEPQAAAILGSLRVEGFSLIQGYVSIT